MGVALFANNAATTLASDITNVATALTVATGKGALFPSPTGGDYFYATLTQAGATETSWEIVKVTARSTDTFTIVRAQDGTSAAAWTAGSKVELRWVKADVPQADGTTLTNTSQTFSVAYGTSSATACVGNDSRLSDARTPVGTALTSTQFWVGDGSNVAAAVAMSGDAALSNTGVLTISAAAVSLAKMANLAANSVIGNNTGSSATPIALTMTQLSAMLAAGTVPQAVTPQLFRGLIFLRPGISGTAYTASSGGTQWNLSTLTTPAITSASVQLGFRHMLFTSATATNSQGGGVSAQQVAWRGGGTNQGGWFGVWRFSQETNVTGNRAFYGLATNSTSVGLSAEPSASGNHLVGVGFDSTDSSSGNYQVYHGDGTTMVKTDLGSGAARDTSTVWELVIYCASNGGSPTVRLTNLTTGTVVLSDTAYSSNIPATTDLMYAHLCLSTGTSGVAVKADVYEVQVETSI